MEGQGARKSLRLDVALRRRSIRGTPHDARWRLARVIAWQSSAQLSDGSSSEGLSQLKAVPRSFAPTSASSAFVPVFTSLLTLINSSDAMAILLCADYLLLTINLTHEHSPLPVALLFFNCSDKPSRMLCCRSWF